MPEIPVTSDILSLLAKILLATRESLLQWQLEGGVLTASLESDYAVMLKQVRDFDGASTEPDHVLTILLKGQELFSVDRRDVSAKDLSDFLGDRLEHSYVFFSELWNRALLQAQKVSEHVDFLNSALRKKLES
jgi:hypothetical protein